VLPANAFELPTNGDLHQIVEGAIDLWIVCYDANRYVSQQNRLLLSPDELTRANRFKFEHPREFYTFCRGSLRRILAPYLQQSAETIRFVYGETGKPSLAGKSKIEFNVSHSGNLFACAVSNGLPLGIDVEEVCPLTDMLSIAMHFFAPAEHAKLVSLDEHDRTLAFYECWTRKEAVIKATGEGVNRPLDSFEVAFGPGAVAGLRRIDDQLSPPWRMHTFEPHPGYVGALISPSPWSALRVFGGSGQVK
jgi:4'-phosphopantetheinyl transferase